MENIPTWVLDIVSEFGPDIVWVLILVLFAHIGLRRVVAKVVNLADDGDDNTQSMLEQRAKTLGNVFTATAKIIIYALALLMVLGMLGIDIRPILTGAGIIGLAVGFGAQSLVKDFVSGLFILIENQYGVGDRVKLGNAEGVVKRITIRSTMLIGEDGKHIYVSNGTVTGKEVVNYSQGEK